MRAPAVGFNSLSFGSATHVLVPYNIKLYAGLRSSGFDYGVRASRQGEHAANADHHHHDHHHDRYDGSSWLHTDTNHHHDCDNARSRGR